MGKRQQALERGEGAGADDGKFRAGNPLQRRADDGRAVGNTQKVCGTTQEIDAQATRFDQRHLVAGERRGDQARKARAAAKIEPSGRPRGRMGEELRGVGKMAQPDLIQRAARDEVLRLILPAQKRLEGIKPLPCFT